MVYHSSKANTLQETLQEIKDEVSELNATVERKTMIIHEKAAKES